MNRHRLPVAVCGALAGLLLAGLLGGCGESTGEPDAVGGPPLVRRLSESQYRATIAAVFGPDIKIPARFERGLRAEGLLAVGSSESGMSPFSIEQYDAAARGIAAAVLAEKNRARVLSCNPAPGAAFDESCAHRFIADHGLRLFRRPLDDAEIARYLDIARNGQARLGDFFAGLELTLAGMLVSPEFLLRIERAMPVDGHTDRLAFDAWTRAARLSFFLTDATPDEALLRAAAAGELDTASGLRRQVDRLIGSPGFEGAVRAFFEDMLQFDRFGDLAKDTVVFPAFSSTVAADSREQTLRTVTGLLVSGDGDYRDLFTTREAQLTRALGIVYRVPVPTRNGWEQTEFPADSHRTGIQSHVAFLALYSHPGRSSATLRGKALREVFLCQEVPDPPPNVNFAAVQDTADASMPTARDRLKIHRTEPACAGCHRIMDPVGLALENYDGLGSWRSTENGTRIDASGTLDGRDFTTPEELGQALHDHPETPRCLVERMYRYAVGRDTRMEERPYMDYLTRAFAAGEYRVPELMRTIALSRNFLTVQAPQADEASGAPEIALRAGEEP